MASIYDLAGTLNKYFTIGNDGITIFYGDFEPTLDIGKVGDIYIQTKLEILDETDTRIGTEPFGRVFYRHIKNGVECWDYVKTYSFDTPIITETETEINSNDFKISIKKADNTNIKESTSDTDFDINHDSYGVSRYASDSEVLIKSVNDLSTPTDKQIIATPKQIATNLKVESDRAISVEGKLTDLNQDLTKTNLVSAINSEHDQRVSEDSHLQEQIDAINARKDVVDIVGSAAELENYNNQYISDNDIIKVLADENHQGRQSYYRWNATTKAFEYIGSDSASYTKEEADDRFVNIDNNETITGTKTFTQTIISQNDGEILDIQNSDGVSISSITSSSSDASNYISLSIADDNAIEVASVDVVYDKAENKAYVTVPLGETTNNTTSTIAASQGWVNDPTLSTNVVHRSGDETVGGTKTFTSSPNVPTVSDTDNSTKAASTAFVQSGLSKKQNTIQITNNDNKKFLSNNGASLIWSIVRDICNIAEMDDTNITDAKSGQTLIYDETSQKWVNGLQTTATIKYW